MVQRLFLLLLALAAVLGAQPASGSSTSSSTSTTATVPRRLQKPTSKARPEGGTVPARPRGVSSVRGGVKAVATPSVWLPILAAYLYNLSIGFSIPVLPKVRVTASRRGCWGRSIN